MIPAASIALLMNTPVQNDGVLVGSGMLTIARVLDTAWGGEYFGYSRYAYGSISPNPIFVSGIKISELDNSRFVYGSETFVSLRVSFQSSVAVPFKYMLLDGVKYYKTEASGSLIASEYTYTWTASILLDRAGQTVPVAFYL